jgi:CheY-like chemotaxis protein
VSFIVPDRRGSRELPRPLAPEDTPVPDRHKPGILVVDGDPTVRALLHRALDRHGFAVALAGDGAEAVQQYRCHKDRIDLVLLELHLEDRDGVQVLAELQKINPAVRGCFSTGYLGSHTEAGLLAAVAVRVFYKPFLLEEAAELLWRLASGEKEPVFTRHSSG